MAATTTEAGKFNVTSATSKTPEQMLYQSSGAIVAAIVIVIIILFTLVVVVLKHCNRQNRIRRELAPKASKQASNPFAQSSIAGSRPTSLVSISSNIPLERKY
ncbi:noncompact myelin-associated protein [Callorhinchus milii]|uniref:noncompact myelin-associated protein n=1 Tax=Callorhinchus milii TaxID=7868 RepID=UPI001C3FC6A6|nr:noncompact myelin-associated protein [Callorhinchus milii]